MGDVKLVFEIPLRLQSHANTRQCWQSKAQRVKFERTAAKLHTMFAIRNLDELCASVSSPLHVKLIRIAQRKLDDDNLAYAFKAIRDGISDALHVNDGDDSIIRWSYSQMNSIPFGVRIEIR
jgi:hypothetical protein